MLNPVHIPNQGPFKVDGRRVCILRRNAMKGLKARIHPPTFQLALSLSCCLLLSPPLRLPFIISLR